ncbi:MAG: peptide chain release factor N(5)-glutamine methyltransferase [Chloroflexota bacterium]
MKRQNFNAGDWLKSTRQKLSLVEDGGLAAQVILAHVLGKSREFILAHPEFLLTDFQAAQLDTLVNRLLKGEPLAYLTGTKEFYGLNFVVNPSVLIPRPETELLVEQALAWLKRHPARRRAVDVGTGSGCIASALLVHVPDLYCVAVDRSMEALQVARLNFERLGVAERVFLVNGNLLDSVAGSFDLVCANLPYIPAGELEGLPVSRYEPLLALNGGNGGLAWIAALAADAPRWLAAGGLLLLEIEARQAEQVVQLIRHHLPVAQVDILNDWQGWPRIVRVERMKG